MSLLPNDFCIRVKRLFGKDISCDDISVGTLDSTKESTRICKKINQFSNVREDRRESYHDELYSYIRRLSEMYRESLQTVKNLLKDHEKSKQDDGMKRMLNDLSSRISNVHLRQYLSQIAMTTGEISKKSIDDLISKVKEVQESERNRLKVKKEEKEEKEEKIKEDFNALEGVKDTPPEEKKEVQPSNWHGKKRETNNENEIPLPPKLPGQLFVPDSLSHVQPVEEDVIIDRKNEEKTSFLLQEVNRLIHDFDAFSILITRGEEIIQLQNLAQDTNGIRLFGAIINSYFSKIR